MSLLAEKNQEVVFEDDLPVIVIGSGPVGIEFVKTAIEIMPSTRFMIFGNEPWEPYNRVKLSSFFAGQLPWDEMLASQRLPASKQIEVVHNCAITEIDRANKTVKDELGNIYAFSRLVLATGSRPFIPTIPGIDLENVFTFRDMSDVEKLAARRARSRKTIVIGGGVLGIEAAHAMGRENTEVGIVDHLPTLMSNQLDQNGSEVLQRYILSLGIELYLGNGVREFVGEDKIKSIVLKDGTEIECDTIILATGIQPNFDLAFHAKLSVNRGVRVNDAMQTSDKNILAIGECAEHRGQVYGVVKPGYEQAKVAAYNLSGKTSNYTGSLTATQLKVVGIPAFSMGQIDSVSIKGLEKEIIYKDQSHHVYRRLVIKNRRIVGAISVGKWDEQNRVQEAIHNRRLIWFWNTRRFLKTGRLWPEENSADVNQWPATAVVCNCNGITRGQITTAINSGLTTIEKIATCTGASTVCGSCKPLVSQMLMSDAVVEPVKWSRSLLSLGMASAVIMMLVMLLPSVSYTNTVETFWQWDVLWRENLYKQISGFSILGLSVVVLLMSVRKRVKKFPFLSFPAWRLIHVVVGFVIIIGLGVHSGYSLGSGLNYFLALCFISLMVAGGLSSVVVSVEHKLDAVLARKIKNKIVWLHIIAFWPLPALLAVHVFKSYYF